MVSRKTLDQYRKALLFAIVWQTLPTLGCVLLAGDHSQPFLMGLLLILVMPAVAATHYYFFIEKTPRESGPSIAIYVMTILVGAFAMLCYYGLMTVFVSTMLRR